MAAEEIIAKGERRFNRWTSSMSAAIALFTLIMALIYGAMIYYSDEVKYRERVDLLVPKVDQVQKDVTDLKTGNARIIQALDDMKEREKK